MDGSFQIGAEAVATPDTFRAVDPSTDALIEPPFSISSPDHVARACALADAAFDAFAETNPEQRARFLEAIAAGIEARGEALVARATQESGLRKHDSQASAGVPPVSCGCSPSTCAADAMPGW